jgi:hypothetical protein
MEYRKVVDINDLLLSAVVDTRLISARIISARIIDFILYLRQKKHLSASTIKVYVSAVIHFYPMNDVTLNRKKIVMYVGEYINKSKKMVLAWTGIWCHRTKWWKGKRKKLQMVVLGAKDLLLSRMSRMLPGLIQRMMLYLR